MGVSGVPVCGVSALGVPKPGGIRAAFLHTEVTDDLYYSSGSLGVLKIPAIDLTVNIYQGTDSLFLLLSLWYCKGNNTK